jgi:(1->4)-alpha-D-glucan 1-alpha-D-glucosylmutase
MSSMRIPGATYRLQFNRNFKFEGAEALVSYLHELGITDMYASPLFQATRGSLHGYSVTNPMELSRELGPRRAFESLARALKDRGMGLLFDIIPNHMALSPDNPWWMEVLENGQGSPYAIFFDIDWHPANCILEGKLLLPILGRPYGQILEDQEHLDRPTLLDCEKLRGLRGDHEIMHFWGLFRAKRMKSMNVPRSYPNPQTVTCGNSAFTA